MLDTKQVKNVIENMLLYVGVFAVTVFVMRPEMLSGGYVVEHIKSLSYLYLTCFLGLAVLLYCRRIYNYGVIESFIRTIALSIIQAALFSVSCAVSSWVLKLLLGGLVFFTSLIAGNYLVVDEKNAERLALYGILGFCFVLYLWLALFLPYNTGPDEYMRYDIPKYIYEYGRLPHGGDPLIRNEIWGFSYGFTPIAGYIPCAIFMRMVSVLSQSDYALLSAARLASVCFSTGTVFFVYKLGKRLFGTTGAMMLSLLLGLWPEFVFISAYVNLDAMGLFAVAWILYAMLKARDEQWSIKSCIFLGIGCGICVMSYYNCYSILVVAIVYCVWALMVDDRVQNKLPFLASRVCIVFCVAFLVGGWVFIRNYLLYDGDFLGLSTSRMYGEMFAQEPYKPSNRMTPASQGMSWYDFFITNAWLESTIKSAIAGFGYMSLFLEDIFYQITYVVLAFSLIMLVSARKMLSNNRLWYRCMVMNIIVVVALSIYYSYASDFQAQGRYILPMLPAFLILITQGWHGLLSAKNTRIGNALVVTLSGFMFVLFYVSVFHVILYAYV